MITDARALMPDLQRATKIAGSEPIPGATATERNRL